MIRTALTGLFLISLFLAGCSAHTAIEPLGEGNIQSNISLGGPIVKAFDMNLPIPYSTAGVVYGLSEKVNISGNLHLTPLPYKLFGLDAGASFFPVMNNGYVPCVGLHGSVLSFVSMKDNIDKRMKIYPTISSTFAWNNGNDRFYTGMDLTVPFTNPDYDNDPVKVIFSPFAGYKLYLGKKLHFTAEIKWQAANVRADQLAAEYFKLSGHGAAALLFSIERSF